MGREPLRTCVGCRRIRPKSELIRVVRRPDGSVVVDRESREPGRGAYVCPGHGDAALKRLGGALRAERIDFTTIGRDLAAADAPTGAR